MMMNVPVPYLDVKCYFNVRENLAGADWQKQDHFDESIHASVTEAMEIPAWANAEAHVSHNPLTRVIEKYFKN